MDEHQDSLESLVQAVMLHGMDAETAGQFAAATLPVLNWLELPVTEWIERNHRAWLATAPENRTYHYVWVLSYLEDDFLERADTLEQLLAWWRSRQDSGSSV